MTRLTHNLSLLSTLCFTLSHSAIADNELNTSLTNAIHETPYSAVLKYTKVDVVEEEHDDKHIYHAQVVETFRGETHDNIEFVGYFEKEEKKELDTNPVIVTLCLDNGIYYWPGTGAQFPTNPETMALSHQTALDIDSKQTEFVQCP
ncbi:hypothetical protein [Vibrio intestinalis]|uniref:hypothetical protein n=1 Tax=Vibrio intestinalis TaxID=2933291 RepID=UPI0021A42A73|nr:hypothetical protein [Vibrio intestinalis]